MTKIERVAFNIQRLMDARGWDRNMLAEKVGIGRGMIDKILSLNKQASFGKQSEVKFAMALHVDISEFYQTPEQVMAMMVGPVAMRTDIINIPVYNYGVVRAGKMKLISSKISNYMLTPLSMTKNICDPEHNTFWLNVFSGLEPKIKDGSMVLVADGLSEDVVVLRNGDLVITSPFWGEGYSTLARFYEEEEDYFFVYEDRNLLPLHIRIGKNLREAFSYLYKVLWVMSEP